MNDVNRRKFIQMGLTAMAASGCMNYSNKLLAEEDVKGGKKGKVFSGNKALVCIYLAGGCDGFNLLIPTSGADYDQYKEVRQEMAIDPADTLSISPTTSPGFNVGLHPKLSSVKSLFDQKKLAFLANVGNLVAPITRQQYKDKAVTVPGQLFSHNSQEDQWQILKNDLRAAPGWGGRMIDLVESTSAVPTGINLSGHNAWILGETSTPYKLKSSGIISYHGMKNEESTSEMTRKALFEKMMDATKYDHPFHKAYGKIHLNSLAIAKKIGVSLDALNEITTTIPSGNRLAEGLMSVAKMIAIQNDLGMNRQVFFIRAGGYDTHDNQLSSMNNLFEDLDGAIEMFQDALEEYGVDDKTLTFTASEFGRSLTSNGDGTDHGWGSHLFAFGTPVKGGEIYGKMPKLEVDGPDDARNGRIIPTLSADQYASTLASWFGFDETERLSLFENLKNFSEKTIPFI